MFQRVEGERNAIQTIKRIKANGIGHILHKNCLLKYVIEGKIQGKLEMTGRRGRRRNPSLDDLREREGIVN